MAETFGWWLVVQVLGLLGLPLTYLLLRRLPDCGYAFAKPIGLLLGGYLFWLLLSLHLLPNRPGSIVWAYLIVAGLSALVLRTRRGEIVAALRERWRVVLAVEVVFTLVLFAGAHLKAFLPEIDGTEKPMDFMLLNAASRNDYYPPDDPWLAGFSVSYYYFGYLINAMVGKLAGLSTAVTFNLGLASTAALAVTAAFGLGYNLLASLRRFDPAKSAGHGVSTSPGRGLQLAVVVGLVAAGLLLIGNLEGALEFGRANGLGSLHFYESVGIDDLTMARESATWHPTETSSFWWWWRATRIIPGTISEFPFFSFLLGDLHPHVMAMPFALSVVALALALWRTPSPLSYDFWRREPALLVLAALVLGSLGFLNVWDLPTYGFVVALLVLAANWRARRAVGPALADTAGFVLPLAVLAVLAYLPFYDGFASQAGGLEAVTGPATRPLHAALIWAPLLIVALPLTLRVALADDLPARGALPLVAGLVLAVGALWLLLVVRGDGGSLGDAVSERGANWLTALFFAGLVVLAGAALWRAAVSDDEELAAAVPALGLVFTGVLLVFGAEFLFISDLFGSRLNTVFKLYYQAWLLLAVGGAYGLVWAVRLWRPTPGRLADGLRGVWAGATALALLAALLYPVGATLSRTEGLARTPRSLDGLDAAELFRADDLAAARWIADHAEGDDRIVEALGGQYSSAGRIAAWTGVPTVLGWLGHEQQWGRDIDLLIQRQADVEAFYSAEALDPAIEFLRRYGITYVVVGNLERATYPSAGLAKFADLPVAFQSGDTTVYRTPVSLAPESVREGVP